MSAWAQDFATDESGAFLISTPADLVKLSQLSNDEATRESVQRATFKQTADLNMKGINFTPMFQSPIMVNGKANNNAGAFKGTYDGQGYAIRNLKVVADEENTFFVALFSCINGATVTRVTLENATILNDSSTPVATGGIIGRNSSCVVANCAVFGLTLDRATEATKATNGSGAVCGYMSDATASVMKNCLTDYTLLCTWGAQASIVNSYVMSDVTFTAPTGELCYILNDNQSENPVWFQTIGDDERPTMNTSHATVYKNGLLACDGKREISVSYSNENEGLNTQDHTFADGVCSVCGGFDMDYVPQVDGVFQIGTPAQLVWYSKYVNAPNKGTSAVLTNDIDMSSVESFEPIGLHIDPENGTHTENDFTGKFDGQGHIISNLKVKTTAGQESGLFGRVQGTITRLGIVNANIESVANAAKEGATGVRSGVLAALILNTQGVSNCYTAGELTVTTTNAEKAPFANLTAFGARTTINSCYTTAASFGAFNDVSGGVAANNSFCGDEAAAMASTGELCYKLNGSQSDNPVWYQTLGEGGDAYPTFDSSHGIVYLAVDQNCDGTPKAGSEVAYSNTAGNRDEHAFVDGICSVCGDFDMGFVPTWNGWFQISTPAQLVWFSKYVSNGNNGACADLVEDLDMAGIVFPPICLYSDNLPHFGNGYEGVFGGGGHIIKNLKVEQGDYESGLFSRISTSGRILDLGIVNADIKTTENERAGVFAGLIVNGGGSEPNIDGCFSWGNIALSSIDATQTGGIVGTNVNGIITNSYTSYNCIMGAGQSTMAATNCYEGEEVLAKAPTGELCFMLNGGSGIPGWFQILGKDEYPTTNGKENGIVYNVEGFGYSNFNYPMQMPQLSNGVYQITNGLELNGFAAMVSESSLKYTGANAVLTQDIDMKDIPFLPIGSRFYENTPKGHYYGTFNGNKHWIKNLVMEGPVNDRAALFGNVGAGATIKDVLIDESCSFTGGSCTAGLIGYAGRLGNPESNELTIKGCSNGATITASEAQSGGFIGRSESATDVPLTIKIIESTNVGKVTGDIQTGGFLGATSANVIFDNCENWADVTGNYHVGGFVGKHDKADNVTLTFVNYCQNSGKVTGTGTSVGGFGGRVDAGFAIEDCSNLGKITGTGCVGGLFGNVVTTGGNKITNCYNYTLAEILANGSSEAKVGGLIGNTGTSVTIIDSYNNGDITGTAEGSKGCVGGLVGVAESDITVEGSWNTGDITGAGNNCGGLVGWESSSQKAVIFRNSFNAGNLSISAGENAGGIIGGNSGRPTVTIENCFNEGRIAGAKNSAALAGWLGNSNDSQTVVLNIANCWNTGTLLNMNGNNTLYRCGSSDKNVVNASNNYDLSGSHETPKQPAPEGYTSDWLESGQLTYFINIKAGKYAYRQNLTYRAEGGQDFGGPSIFKTHDIVTMISDAGFGTFYAEEDLLTEGMDVKVYTGKFTSSCLALTELSGGIPAKTAVVVEGAPGFYSFEPTKKGLTAVADNDLKGTAEPLTSTGSQYVLANKDNVVGFYKATEGTVIPFGKAYLLPTSAGDGGGALAKVYTFDFAGTGIEKVETSTDNETIFDLSGRRMEKATKGVFIVNGKKVLK